MYLELNTLIKVIFLIIIYLAFKFFILFLITYKNSLFKVNKINL